jgi:RNase P protein component
MTGQTDKKMIKAAAERSRARRAYRRCFIGCDQATLDHHNEPGASIPLLAQWWASL